MKKKSIKNIKDAFSLGYFISMINDYFSFVSVKGILRINNNRIVKKSLDLLLDFDEEYKEIFGDEIIVFPNMTTSGQIIEYFDCIYEFLKDEVNKKCKGIIELAFFLGGLIAITELSGPYNYETEELKNILCTLFDELESDTDDFRISEIVEDLNSYNLETRKNARDTILFLIFEDEFVFSKIALISDWERVIYKSVI